MLHCLVMLTQITITSNIKHCMKLQIDLQLLYGVIITKFVTNLKIMNIDSIIFYTNTNDCISAVYQIALSQ